MTLSDLTEQNIRFAGSTFYAAHRGKTTGAPKLEHALASDRNAWLCASRRVLKCYRKRAIARSREWSYDFCERREDYRLQGGILMYIVKEILAAIVFLGVYCALTRSIYREMAVSKKPR